MSVYKFIGSQSNQGISDFYNFLNTNKVGTFLEDVTITYNQTSGYTDVDLTKNNSVLKIRYNLLSAVPASIQFTNGDCSITINGNASSSSFASNFVASALLNTNGLMFKTIHNGSNVWYWALTIDSNGEFAFIMPSITALANSNTTRLKLIVGDSLAPTALNVEAVFGTQKTGLIPVVINTTVGETTIPVFYTSMQTELPGLGLQSGRMDSVDYITNGYCFIRDE